MKSRFLFLILILLVLVNPAHAQSAEKPFAQEPLYSLAVKDAAMLKDLLQKNAWMQEFQRTTVFRGLMHRAGPVVTALARPEDAWKGRLLDFVYEKALNGRPVEIDYYSKRDLNPLVFRARGLGTSELKTLDLLFKAFNNGENKPFLVQTRTAPMQINVTPLRLHTEKLAVYLGGDCLVAGRDPQLVAKSSTLCEAAPKYAHDGQLTVNLPDLLPSLRGVINRFYAAGSTVQLDLIWQAAGSRFVIPSAQLSVENSDALVSGALPGTWAKALPATSPLVLTQFVPEPKSWTLQGFSEVLAVPVKDWSKRKAIPVTLVFLGMHREPKSQVWKPLSALLVPAPSRGNEALVGLSGVFSDLKHYEVAFRRVCQNMIVFSPEPESIRLIENACKGQAASFAQMPPEFLKPLQTGQHSSVMFANTGRFFNSLLEIGTRRGKWNEAQVKQARTLLTGLPSYMFQGSKEQKALVFKGVSR